MSRDKQNLWFLHQDFGIDNKILFGVPKGFNNTDKGHFYE